MIIPFIKENIDKEIYRIFPKIIIVDAYNDLNNNIIDNNFCLDYLQIVHFHIYNSELKDTQYTIGHYNNCTYLIKSFIHSLNIIYVIPLINNYYLHFMDHRGLKISYITKREQWYDDFDLLSFYINDTDINYYLQKLYHQMNFNIKYDQFKEYLQQIIIVVKANELLIHI